MLKVPISHLINKIKASLSNGNIQSIVDKVKNKKRSALMVTIIVFIIIFISAILFNQSPPPEVKSIEHPLVEIEQSDTGLSAWQAQSTDELNDITQKLSKLITDKELETKRYDNLEKKIDMLDSRLTQQQEQIQGIQLKKVSINEPDMMTVSPEKLKGYPGLKTSPGGQSFAINNEMNNEMVKINYPAKNDIQSSFNHIGISNPDSDETNKDVSNTNYESTLGTELAIYSSNNSSSENSRMTNIIPMGSFFKVALLNGLEAGTGQESQSNPQPVLLRVIDNAFLPNAYRYQVKSCFVLGSAYGSLSSERVFIRMARISCVGLGGKAVISENMEGYIVDSDGKIGLRGKVVSRQGAKLGMAMLAGFSSGIATAFGNAQGTSTISPFGVSNTISSTQALKQAGMGGASSASQELAQFYIRQAETIFPVIEVNAGRIVTVTLSQGLIPRWHSGHGNKDINDLNKASSISTDKESDSEQPHINFKSDQKQPRPANNFILDNNFSSDNINNTSFQLPNK